jgi:outer membrane protein TolC
MQVLKLLALLCLLSSSVVFANENSYALDSYISDYKKEQFKYDYEKNEADGTKLKDSWIAPIQLNYSYIRSKPGAKELTKESASIRIDQPIFRSGGIYYGIKYADASKLYADYSVDVAKRKMIKNAISLLMQIKEMTLKIEKQELLIRNADINIEQKKEQYLNGRLDSGFLDDAIIQKNVVTQALYDIETSKEKLITQFETLSDLNYESVAIPHLEFITHDAFIQNNIVLKQSASEIEKNRYNKDVVVAQYLPKISFTGGYNWSSGEQFLSNNLIIKNELAYYDYGLKFSMPIDFNTFRDIESSKVTYLKTKVTIKDKERELDALFRQVMNNIENFDKKIALSGGSIELYTKLLEDTKTLYEVGHKTQYDVDTLQNSLKIQNLDAKIFEIDKQMELLSLYEMYGGE